MARTVNATLRTVRRDAFLDVAQRLVETKGYEAMSIQDVLDELDASKGAFYHYFDSKQALLEAVVERFGDRSMAATSPILNDPNLPALRKLEKFFAGIARLKGEQKELMIAIMDVWRSDGNAIVREKVRRISERLLVPLLTSVIRQGVEEGTCHVSSPEETATVLMTMMSGFQETAVEMFMARQAGTIPFDAVQRSIASFTQAFERILGTQEGSLTLTDESTLHFWFG